MKLYEQVQASAGTIIRAIAPLTPKIGVVLGSGLGSFADALEAPRVLPQQEIPGFPKSTVEGHAGKVVAGLCGGTPVLVMQGRVHLYEGYSIDEVVLPVRTMVAAGCRTIILTNAAGGIGDDMSSGDLAVISDHINLTGRNPLVGPSEQYAHSRIGPRFPDMSTAYDMQLIAIAHEQAKAERIALKEGVYCGVTGPSYETPAEIRMMRTIGADLVGMSTVHETIAAVQMGARVLGLSCVTNKASGLGGTLSHDDVKAMALQAKPRFIALMSRIIATVGATGQSGYFPSIR